MRENRYQNQKHICLKIKFVTTHSIKHLTNPPAPVSCDRRINGRGVGITCFPFFPMATWIADLFTGCEANPYLTPPFYRQALVETYIQHRIFIIDYGYPIAYPQPQLYIDAYHYCQHFAYLPLRPYDASTGIKLELPRLYRRVQLNVYGQEARIESFFDRQSHMMSHFAAKLMGATKAMGDWDNCQVIV